MSLLFSRYDAIRVHNYTCYVIAFLQIYGIESIWVPIIMCELNCLSSSSTAEKKVLSNVWVYYEKTKDAPKARCTICDKELSYCSGTRNSQVHLTSKRSLLYT